MLGIEYILLIISALVLLSIVVARLSENLGVPVLLLFLALGMLAGSEGLNAIRKIDIEVAQSLGMIALILILFSGGADTRWHAVRPVLWQTLTLSTFGVLFTTVAVGLLTSSLLVLSVQEGLLIGAIVSSTDAAAVFAVLRSKNISLRGNLTPLIEAESGSNDPMAMFLTIGMIAFMGAGEPSVPSFLLLFVYQMGFGALFGFAGGKGLVYALNRMNFYAQGFYPVFVLASLFLIFSVTAVVNGSGILAVYVAGLVLGNSDVIQKRSLLRFFDGLAWLGQIAMFLALGLLVVPSALMEVAGAGLLVAALLMVVARPVSVFLSLAFSRLRWREKTLVSWVGIRGAVPIILATFPLQAHIPNATFVFNIVFFVVIMSALLQGWSIPLVARWLHVTAPMKQKPHYALEFESPKGSDTELVDFIVSQHSAVVGVPIVQLGLPADSLIVLIVRSGEYIVPSGGTLLEPGDTILALVNKTNLPQIRGLLSRMKGE
jgi:cell volume regulation protein A